jgi:predicted dehydrogenase
MGKRHRARFEACGVRFVQVVDADDVIVENNVDFAVIASPATSHYDYAKYFLERHVAVFVEKPLAISGSEAQELVELSQRNGTVLFVAQSECFNPLFLNFRKHFLTELRSLNRGDAKPVNARLEFRREHRYSERCRDVNVSLDLLVHDLGLFFTLFKFEDVDVLGKSVVGMDAVKMCLKVMRGPYKGVEADFCVNRDSDVDVRTISVSYGRQGSSPGSNYTVSLARYNDDGEIAHIPDSLENEHRFFLKLLAGACTDWGKRLAQTAADCVKITSRIFLSCEKIC